MGSFKVSSDDNNNNNNDRIDFFNTTNESVQEARDAAMEGYLTELHQHGEKHQGDASKKKLGALKYYAQHKDNVKILLKRLLLRKCEDTWRAGERLLRRKNYLSFLNKAWELYQFSGQAAWDLEEKGENPSPDAIGKITDELAAQMNRAVNMDIGNVTRHNARVLYEAINDVVTENGDDELTRISSNLANALNGFAKIDDQLRQQMDQKGFVPPPKELNEAKKAVREYIAQIYCNKNYTDNDFKGCKSIISKIEALGKAMPVSESKRKLHRFNCAVKPFAQEDQRQAILAQAKADMKKITQKYTAKVHFELGAKKAIALLEQKRLALRHQKDETSQSKAKLLGEVSELLINRLNDKELRPTDFQYLLGLQKNAIINTPVLSQYWLVRKVQQLFPHKTGTYQTIDQALKSVCDGIKLARRAALRH